MMRRLTGSPQRFSILVGLIIAVFGYFVVIGGAQQTLAEREESLVACRDEIKTAQDTIRHAADVDALSRAVVQQVNGVAHPPNETVFIEEIWKESQRIASAHHVTLTDLHHDRVTTGTIAIAAASPAPKRAGECLPATEALAYGFATPVPTMVPGGSQGARAARSPMPVNGVALDALPVIATVQGPYLDVIKAIADFARARVLLRYDKSNFQVPDQRYRGVVSATVTLLAYPPIKIDALGRPVGQFESIRDASFPQPAASPTATPPSTPTNPSAATTQNAISGGASS